MVSALICSGQLSLSAWEPYIQSQATQAESVERRWRGWLGNSRVRVSRIEIECGRGTPECGQYLYPGERNSWLPHLHSKRQ